MTEQFTISTLVPPQRVAEAFVTAIEGGSTYWLARVSHLAGDYKLIDGAWYASPDLLASDAFRAKIVVAAGEGDDIPIGISRENIERGLGLMAEKHPHHFADLVSGEGDAEAADVFLQYVTFGKVVYG